MTIRSEGQFNTVVYEEEDIYRGQERRDVVLMNGEDMQRLGLAEGARVVVRSDVGEMTALARKIDIAPGCAAMYYPEANVLVSRAVDPRSRTPAFKSVLVDVTLAELPQPAVELTPLTVGGTKPVLASTRGTMKAC
jgi:anaerobic selenocysteine-containing dehydrogenase